MLSSLSKQWAGRRGTRQVDGQEEGVWCSAAAVLPCRKVQDKLPAPGQRVGKGIGSMVVLPHA